jgi:hypothetical protein
MTRRNPQSPGPARDVYPKKKDDIQLHEVEDGYIASDAGDRVHT